MDHERLLNILKQENALLRERNRALEDILMGTLTLPIEWCLTTSEERVFGVLVNREVATKEAIMAALYCDRHDADGDVAPKIVDVFICKIRRKLSPFGVELKTLWGRGYALDASTREKYRPDHRRAAHG